MNSEYTPKPNLHELPRISDRLSFLYVEHCVVNRKDSALTFTDERGTAFMPVATISVLMLGPGTNITHRAMELIGDAGASVIWVGEYGVRYYASGRPLTHSARLAILQAELVTNTRRRLKVARAMYQMRFPDEDVSMLTMGQLRGREGARVRAVYKKLAHKTGVKWSGREYDPDDYAAGSTINQALSLAHQCLYGIAHSVIVALGCSPALGFVHTGHERSFVYDVADLYKANISIPAAFEACQREEALNIERTVRLIVRDKIHEEKLLVRMSKDIGKLLLCADEDIHDDDFSVSELKLWDDKLEDVKSGTSYGKELDFENGDAFYDDLVERSW
ncbi:MAG: type I-E CRISPR-associated endonuclease Cas1e [Candidatus Ancillula sp.]|jgi:CRISPR-associated protein Cas1|nr:type I-E CRISPR-associated endonuclease Cas1e [Candidatus Ancillula sp.]